MKKLLCLILAIAMVFGTMGTVVFAEADPATHISTGGTVTINEDTTTYSSLTEAAANAVAVDGVVTYNISGAVEYETKTELSVDEADVKIVGVNGADEDSVTLTKSYCDGFYVSGKNLTIENITIHDLSDQSNAESALTAWEWMYIDFNFRHTALNIVCNNVTFTEGVMVKGENSATFNGCTFDVQSDKWQKSKYSIWVTSSAEVKVIDNDFNGVRGIKVDDVYGGKVADLTVEENTFNNLSQKPAINWSNANGGTLVMNDNEVITEEYGKGILAVEAPVALSGNDLNNMKASVTVGGETTYYATAEEAAADAGDDTLVETVVAMVVKDTITSSYSSFADAAAEAVAGDTIIIMDNLSELADVVNGGNSLAGITIKLGADFDLAGVEWTPIGNSSNQFKGYFDGDNHTISNLTVTGNNRYAGLFGYIKGSSMAATTTPTVQNLNIVNASVEGDWFVGGLSGQGYTCAVKNVTYSGEVSGVRYVGGLIGHVYTYFEDCHFKGEVNASFDAGGGIAGAGDGRVYNSSVIGTVSGNNWMGGVIGNGQEGTSVVGCYVKATVSSGSNWYYGIGGIAGVAGHGYASSEFKNNYFDGEVYLCDEKVEAIVAGLVNADSNEDIKATVSGNSWNTEYYPADTQVFITAELSSSSPSADEWKAAAAEEFTQSRNNNLVMLESDLEYVDTVNPEDVTIMRFSEVTEEAVEEATKANIVAQIGETPYASLTDAIAAADADDVITIIDDIALDTKTLEIAKGKNISIDLNGKMISGVHGAAYSMIHVQNGAELTVKDSAEGGKITYAAGGNNTGAAVWVEGKFTLESGTIELTGAWTLGFAVDLRPNAWGTAHTVGAAFVMNGGTVKSTDTAVRVASNSSDNYDELGVTFTMNDGTIESDWDAIFVQHLYVGDLNIDIVNGTVSGDNSAMRIYGDAGSDIDMNVTNGTFIGEIKVPEAYADADAIAITGGTFTSNVSEYVVDGFDLYRTANGYTVIDETSEEGKATASSISVEYEDVTEDGVEGEKTYAIVVKANDEDVINELASVDLTFAYTTAPVTGGAIDFTVAPAEDFSITRYGTSDRYMFNYSGVNAFEGTGNAITVGTITVTGYGAYTIATADADTNIVNATTRDDNLVDSYTAAGAEDKDLTTGALITTDVVDDGAIAVPVRTLKVTIDFPNAVKENAAAYQAMKVEITGTIDGVNQTVAYDLGTDGDFEMSNGDYVVTEDRLVLNNAYTVTVSGAGYRTARYTVTMTEDKELTFWNNVMDEDRAVEEGVFTTKKSFLAGDIVKDNNINIYDLSAVVSYFAKENNTEEYSDYAKYDLDRNGVIDSRDVAYVLVSWGE